MKQIVDSEIKKIELDILLFIDSFCRANKINYSMAYGTLLGAIRHKGFIPWDDDIDIFMLRKDFEKFSSMFNSAHNSKYKLLWISTDKNYNLPLPKVVDSSTILIQNGQRRCKNLGVYVDIFIYDSIPDDDVLKNKIVKKVDTLQKYWSYSICKPPKSGSAFKKIIRFLIYSFFHIINPRFFVKKINKVSQTYTDCDTKKVGSLTYTGARRRFLFEKKWISELVELPFEGCCFFACADYNSYLCYRYGNYLELPPKEKQISNHDFKAYYKE